MVIERDLLISLLKLTKDGPVLVENVKRDAKITMSIARKLLEKLQSEGMVYLNQDTVEADSYSRLKLAVKAVSTGSDMEYVSNMLRWQEFEEIAAVALERNGYTVAKNVRFKHAGRKWEIDIVGCRKPLVICIDCKHWRHGTSPSALKRIAEAQVERTRALAESLPNMSLELECTKWEKAKFAPAILTLMPVRFKFYDKVPIVPVLQLQDFLSQLPAYTEALKYFLKEFNHLRHDF
jgi:Holliday junction resolvase-like predicted endonuclease